MKRSNRLVLLIGLFLALVAFVLVAVTLQGKPSGTATPVAPTTAKIVVATMHVPLGAKITSEAVTTKDFALNDKPADGFGDTALVVGKTARESLEKDQYVSRAAIDGTSGLINDIEVPAGKLGIALQVDQVSGVGTLTKPGDYVDMLVALTGDKFPVVTLNPTDQSVTVVSGLNSTSVKLLLQGLQVLGTLLPPPPAETGNNAQASPGSAGGTTSLNGQQQIVILAVDAQQSEVIKYAQVDGSISLVLRSADDFRDPVTGLPLDPTLIVPAQTTGATLRQLVDAYGVLVPELVEAIVPLASPTPRP